MHNKSMYIRKVGQKNHRTGKYYFTYRLVETYRNAENKVRQRVLLNLGANFDVSTGDWKVLADRIEDILSGQEQLILDTGPLEEMAQSIAKRIVHRIAIIPPSQLVTINDYQEIDINSLDNQNIRQIGPEYVGLSIAQALKIDDVFKSLAFNQTQMNTALGSIIGKLVAPGSERSIHNYLQTQSGLDELIGCDFQQLSLNQLYQISDKLVQHKSAIEQALFKREQELFELDNIITLYDLTNTYFEGRALNNQKAAFGRSKEKRYDCPLVTLGLVLDASGFPKCSEVFEGNASEPKTLKKMINRLCKKKPAAEKNSTTREHIEIDEARKKTHKNPTIVLDAGISSEDNLTWLKDNGYDYIVVSKKAKKKCPDENDVIIRHQKEDYVIKGKLIDNQETGEKELYCHSEAKAKKEESMSAQAASRYEGQLVKLSEGLEKPRTKKAYAYILQRLGRLKEKHKQVANRYEVTVATDEDKEIAKSITWKTLPNKQKTPGIYCLRTNRTDLDEQSLWDTYIMLSDLEAAFRCLKTELGLRPVYHQKTKRVDGHIFITVLAYHVMHTIRCQLKASGIHESWLTIRKELSNHCRITTTMKLRTGETLHVRKSNRPTPRQIEIYQALNLNTVPGKTEKVIL